MPAALDLRAKIAAALGDFGPKPLFDASIGLFDVLGYSIPPIANLSRPATHIRKGRRSCNRPTASGSVGRSG